MHRKQELATRLFDQALDRADCGSLTEAFELIEEVLRLEPTEPLYLINKAQLLLDLDRPSEAKDVAQQSLSIEATDCGWALLGVIHGRLQDAHTAADCFKEAIRIREDFNYYTLLASAQAAFDTGAARGSAMRAIELNRDWDEAWYALGVIEQGSKNYRKAAECFERAIQIDPLPKYLTALAGVQMKFDVHKAFKTAQLALDKDPGDETAAALLEGARRRLE